MRGRGGRGPLLAGVLLTVVSTVALAGACGSGNQAGTAGDASGTGAPGTLAGLQRDPPLEVGGVQLPEVTDGADGAPMAMRAEPGKLLAVYFGYTNCPDLCPTTMADLKVAKRKLGAEGDRLDVAFVTVDPQRDTAELLNRYLRSFFDHFHVLRTEDPGALAAAEGPFLASSSLTPNGDGTYEVSHTATTAVVDDSGTVLLEWPFGTTPDVMAEDLRILLSRMPSPATPTKGTNR